MDNFLKFEELRKKYSEFYFNSYRLREDNEALYLEYEFEILNLSKFNPQIKILKKDFKLRDINSLYVKNMVFHIGLIELISYWKCTCSPKIVIKCGFLDSYQINWFKKLYFYGLSELFYKNNIKTDIESFVNIECMQNENIFDYEEISDSFNGFIVPVGGGKDSIVTLETLNLNTDNDYCFILNPKPVTLECARLRGFKDKNIIEVYRNIDKNLIALNKEGFINGHTPFSSLLSFLSYFIAFLLSKKYIALSNESSSNESNIIGEKINHQYSKSFEFECDFREYSKEYLKTPVEYFSFLRPLNELQIAEIFSKKEKYHKIFKSCNVGSKEKEWIWCCNCAKCLFTFIILSPYLYKERLTQIFGEDLFEKESLLDIFLELTGNKDIKPFDCVGTFEEVNIAICETIKNLEDKGLELPFLLNYYKNNFEILNLMDDLVLNYNKENNLTKEQEGILKKEVFSND